MTKLLNKAQQIVDQAKSHDEGNHDTSESDRSSNISSTVQKLTGIIDSIESKLSWLKILDEEIVDLTPQEKIEDTIVEADNLLESHLFKERKLNTFLQKYIQLSKSSNVSTSSVNAQSTRRVNLPKLQLPTFEGQVLNFSTFHTAFCAAIHNDVNLTNLQKFQYLRANLKGEALSLVDGLTLTDANYNEAMSLLKTRYGQPHKLITAYMKALWEIPKPDNSVESIKKFHDNIETYKRNHSQKPRMPMVTYSCHY